VDETHACKRRLGRLGLDKVPTPAGRCRRPGSRRSNAPLPSRTDDVVKMLPRREAALRLARLRNRGGWQAASTDQIASVDEVDA
jgi:hypothetical protein